MLLFCSEIKLFQKTNAYVNNADTNIRIGIMHNAGLP